MPLGTNKRANFAHLLLDRITDLACDLVKPARDRVQLFRADGNISRHAQEANLRLSNSRAWDTSASDHLRIDCQKAAYRPAYRYG
ncbi:hypothetical protein GCM10027167_76540 [Nocardia heshunensis]